MTIQLIKPTKVLEKEYQAFYLEWKRSGEKLMPWIIKKFPDDIDRFLQFIDDNEKGVNLPDGWVPDSTFWLVKDRLIIGVVNIRHQLTEMLLSIGGHIGYGIRPSERRKGYGTKILELALLEANKLDINKALVTCDSDNIGSQKAILHNKGIEDQEFVEDDGTVVKRFWIEL
ncbi:Predicted acetyltransferase [Gracilibacillus orientalis]|uniref:Predicted acetyltransferase n=1 Tax=Gracilibacillus orientalis TaxID=334253 RepID=A0A1I4HEJ0_9BACI|nr:GNAT family N-acetyltransferase [Gracilibacillus orientalis]SFL40544.1 Predicted acetyltransferase [Gracilibacillus orientalis]